MFCQVTAAITNTYEKVDDEMYLNLQRALAKAKKQRAARRKYLRSNGVDAPSSDEEVEKVLDEYGDEVEKVDKYKEATEKLVAARTKPAKTEGSLSKFRKSLGRLISFRSKSASDGDPNNFAQGTPAPEMSSPPGTVGPSSVLPGPPTGQQVPLLGQQQQMPMNGQQQQMPMMGQQQQMPMMGHQQQASFIGQVPTSNTGQISAQPGPTATIGGAPSDSITDNGIQIGAPTGTPMGAPVAMESPMSTGDAITIGAPMGAPMAMGPPTGPPMGALMGAPGAVGMQNAFQDPIPGTAAPNVQSVYSNSNPGRDRMMQAKMREHQAMVSVLSNAIDVASVIYDN